MRFFTKRNVLLALALVTILVIGALISAVAYLRSPAFAAYTRQHIVQEIEHSTGAKVTLQDFDWDFWQRKIRLEGLTLRGLEPSGEAPLAYINRIDIGLNIRSLLERRIDLFELRVTRPEFHIIVSPDGKTNFPPVDSTVHNPFDFEISVQNFNVVDGEAILNERRINVDLSLTNLAAILNYYAAREVLETHFRFDGVLDRAPDVALPIPYTFYADMDYTRDTIIAQRIVVNSGRNQAQLQGKISQALSSSLSGKLDYSGMFDVPFLNYFFTMEQFGGTASAAGSLEFSDGKFFTQGKVTSDAVDFDSWHITKVSSEYAYSFPERQLTVKKHKSALMDGSLSGDIVVENLPGPSKVVLDLSFANIDAASLTRAYPWDPKYRIFSTATGTINGWFEGRLERFDFSGHANLKSYTPPRGSGFVALPVDGSADYVLMPDIARLSNAQGRFYSTVVEANGVVHATMSNLQVNAASTDLKELAFLYPDANGSGTFKGSVTGAITKPLLDGEFTLDNHVFRQWKIPHTEGSIRLDVAAESAVLKNVRVRQGDSEVLLNGSAALSGSPVDLRIQSNRVTAQDIRPYLDRDIEGVFAGNVRVTGLSPDIKLEGDVRADNLSLDNHVIGNARGHVRYFEPAIDIEQLTIRQGEANLTGNVSFNRMTEAMKFTARLDSTNLQMFYPLGLPDTIQGVISQADLQGSGTIKQPIVQGNATLRDVSVNGEVFPQARINLTATGTKLDAEVVAGRDLNLKAQIDTAAAGYPFTATVNFSQYPVEQIAKFSGGSIIASGNANLSGSLTNRDRLRGDGRIESAEVRVQETILRPTQPFTFSFDSSALTLSNVTFTGESTHVTLGGTIAFKDPATLNLRVMGQVDLKLLEAKYPEFLSTGSVDLQVDVRGTPQSPDLRGSAVVTNASLRRQGVITGLTNVTGNLSFNQNQIRIDNIQGTAGGGTVHAEGTALLQGNTIQGMNIEIVMNDVRVRGYPEGLRTVVGSRLTLRGTLDSPLLDGNIQIQSLAFKGGFEDLLAFLSQENLQTSSSPLGRMRLSLHVEGGKNITIQNQLAEVEARVEIDVKGTADQPAITGHVEASGGTLLFQGNRYTVTRGNIDFVDPLRIEPVLDIEAEAQVRDYRVILSISGRGNNPRLTMRSDPPLPELEIVSLITGGLSRDEIAQRSSTAPTSERLFQSGAASILSDLIRERVGNKLGLLGNGRVRIDPFAVGAENTQSARITLSEQITKDLAVTYSQDLTSNRAQVILIEYFVSRNTSIVASRDEYGNFGLDLRHRTRIK